MSSTIPGLQKTAAYLAAHREALVDAWSRAVAELSPGPTAEIRSYCSRTVDTLLGRLSQGEVDVLLRDEALAAIDSARTGASLHPLALSIRVLDRCCLPFLLAGIPDRETLAEALLALDELGDRRLESLLKAQEQETQRRIEEVQEQAARADERAREVSRANEALRQSEAHSQRRADQIALISSVARRIAAVLEPERLMQEAADAIQARMSYSYVAVVVLDDEGVLVGRWAGRPGVGRRSSGRAQGPARGIIGRALRKRAPQVVPEVWTDPDYHADVAGARSEMAIPLLEEGEPVGALDFQSERPGAFDLDDVAAGEALAEFLIIALRNARLFAAARGASA
jgi:putative methionine-R-sulfoxide reductase with GAF domain